MIVFAWRFLYGRRGRRGLNSVVLGFLGLKSGAVAESIGFCVGGICFSTVDTGVWGKIDVYGRGVGSAVGGVGSGTGLDIVMEMCSGDGVVR